ncbi:MAG: FkbM family methyltransferase [Gemmatimonadaceae bacterium]
MLDDDDAVVTRRLPEPIVLVDVGCRGGVPGELWPLRRQLQHVGFDADADECARLNAEPHDLAGRTIYPVFVGGEEGTSAFHIFREPGDSSALQPDARFAALFADPTFIVDRTVQVESTTMDAFFASHPELARPDLIKLDSQGTELEILRGATACLKTCSLVEIEVEFTPMYAGQALFHDLMGFMLAQGFDLLFLNRFSRQRRGYPGYAKGQLTFGDALFVRREDRLDDYDAGRIARFVTLLINYGHLDLAHHLLAARRLPPDDQEFHEEYLRRRFGFRGRRRLAGLVNPFVDKLVLLLLHLRGHNGLRFDSDRSWPTR